MYFCKIPSDFNFKTKSNLILLIRKLIPMQVSCTTPIINQDNYVIPIFEIHPIMNEKVIKDYERVLTYSGLKLHEQISHRNVKIQESDFIHQIYTKS